MKIIRRMNFLLIGFIVCAGLTSAASAGNNDIGALEQQQPVFAADVYGGYSSSHILVKVKSGIDAHKLLASINNSQLDNSSKRNLQIAELRNLMQNYRVQSINQKMNGIFSFAESAASIGLDRWYVINVPVGTDTLKMVDDFSRITDVFEVVEIAGIGGIANLPDDPSFNLQYSLHNIGQSIQGRSGTNDADVDGPEAWDMYTGIGGDITLAVIDSGVDSHTEFSDRMVPGWNTYNNSGDTSDGCPHGTHVAGISGALGNNGVGVAGMNWGVKIMPVRVLSGCSGSTDQCADGIIYAVDHGARIGTMSLQYYTFSQYFEDSTIYAHDNNVLLIAANGNSRGRLISYPAKFEFCMGIAAVNNQDVRAYFSNYGPECDLSAGGEDVYSTWVGNSYTYLSGTSMATPLVSGLASLIWSYDPTLTNDEVWNILVATADDINTPGWDEYTGWGRVNAASAMAAIYNGMYLQVPLYINAGQSYDITASGVVPGTTVYFVYSLKGAGSKYIPALDVTLDLKQPQLFGTADADANGNATVNTYVVSKATGKQAWCQALAYQMKSNVIERTVN